MSFTFAGTTQPHHQLRAQYDDLQVYVHSLRQTIERLGRELNTVRRMNHHLAKLPPPPEINYMPPPFRPRTR